MTSARKGAKASGRLLTGKVSLRGETNIKNSSRNSAYSIYSVGDGGK